ncbi:Major Facilitator Superfamily protein [Trichomonas vaginalis G3]|uniref:Lysosomal dipeptide transporter MFSD1 n=1 Tax=Trichomonas vaginalis (strain ATCC PRA-98 / G3) TaxID=412133 RepID=A2DL06_TRIV3|nr:major facilitator superfamily transporter [Trichomonas vaginalis G3]EAY18959.1 Major Facilitator Superfamily protein [Trichomonas vaginalis G3]KAI5532025.1 Major Facilitator Superfamily [Trichomonas vaginalis G3]|eukprot:XP_001579945.1 major facilitator superfamily transporter [Trichomonas vaginalis G3]
MENPLDATPEKRSWKFHFMRVLTYAVPSFLYAIVQFQKLCPSVVVEDMAQAYGVTTQKLAVFSSCYFYPYALMQPFAGLMADLFDPCRVLGIFGLISAIGSAICGFSTKIQIGIVGRFLVGFGCGPTYVSVMRISANWFKLHQLPTLLGILMAVSCIGGAGAATPLAIFCEKYGWRAAFYSLSGASAFCALIILIFTRGSPERQGYEPVNEPPISADKDMRMGQKCSLLLKNIKEVVTYWQFWVIVVFTVTVCCPFLNIGGYWGGPFLTDVYNYNNEQKSNTLLALHVGVFTGSLTLPYIAQAFNLKKWIMILSSIASLGVSTVMYFKGDKLNNIELWAVLVVIGIFTLTISSISYPLVSEYYPPMVAGSAVGSANLFLFLFVAIYQLVSSWLVPMKGSTPTPSGIPKYTWEGYRNGVWLFSCVSFAVSGIAAAISRDPTGKSCCKKKESPLDEATLITQNTTYT